MRRLLAGLSLLLLAAACTDRGATSTPVPSPRPPTTPAGVVEGEIIGGSISKLRSTIASMRGRPVVVNYWATWCEPCKAEMPRIVDAYEEYAERVAFLGVNVEDDIEAAESFVRRYEMPFRSISDPEGEILREEKILGLPVTQFYGSDGKLAFVHQGEIKADDLDEKIEEVLRSDA